MSLIIKTPAILGMPELSNQEARTASGKTEVEDQRNGLRVVDVVGKDCEIEGWQDGHRVAAKDCRMCIHDSEWDMAGSYELYGVAPGVEDGTEDWPRQEVEAGDKNDIVVDVAGDDSKERKQLGSDSYDQHPDSHHRWQQSCRSLQSWM